MENSQGCSLCQQSGRVVTPQEPTIKQILGHSSCQKSSENEKGFSVKERPRGARRALWGKVHPEERVISANKYRGGPALDENAELVGRFLWLKKLPLAQLLGQGLNTQICDHPFLVVDHHKDLVRPGQKPTGYLKVCMVNAFSKMTPERSRQLANTNKRLIPIWPNPASHCADPEIVFLNSPEQSTPRPSWINVSDVYFVKEDCFQIEEDSTWGELRLGSCSIHMIRRRLNLTFESDPKMEVMMNLIKIRAAKLDARRQNTSAITQATTGTYIEEPPIAGGLLDAAFCEYLSLQRKKSGI